jgi:hypothetical protein
MNGLTSLGWQIHDHLKARRQKMCQELKAQGCLNATVLRMQTDAHAQMDSLENADSITTKRGRSSRTTCFCQARRTCRTSGRVYSHTRIERLWEN